MSTQDSDDLVRRSEALYAQQLRAKLEAAHMNEYVAIEPDSGDYFLGETLSDAILAARRAHPDRLVYGMRVGHKAAVYLGGFKA